MQIRLGLDSQRSATPATDKPLRESHSLMPDTPVSISRGITRVTVGFSSAKWE
jgi:hypothetical protein